MYKNFYDEYFDFVKEENIDSYGFLENYNCLDLGLEVNDFNKINIDISNDELIKMEYLNFHCFLHGHCLFFAHAVNKVFGYTIEETIDKDNGLIHSYCYFFKDNKKNYIDIRGITNNPKLFFGPFED